MTRTPAERRLEELAATHGPRVLAYLARRTTPAEDAADVLQEVLTTAWRRITDAPDDDPDHALAWLPAIARRTLANHRRGQARRHDATSRLRAELAGGRPPALEQDPAVDGVRAALLHLGTDDRGGARAGVLGRAHRRAGRHRARRHPRLRPQAAATRPRAAATRPRAAAPRARRRGAARVTTR